MSDARDVARVLIGVGHDPSAPDESISISPLRLQKLLYYCQGWSLALLGRPLFYQPIEAWENGPVVRDVYALFARRRTGLSPDDAGPLTAAPAEADLKLIRAVWREYSRFTPGELIEMTHAEPPWREARGSLPPTAPSSTPLSAATMAAYFTELAREKTPKVDGFPGVDPVSDWRESAEWESAGKPSVDASDLFGELLRHGR